MDGDTTVDGDTGSVDGDTGSVDGDTGSVDGDTGSVDGDTAQRAKEFAARDPFPLKGFGRLEWWVGNAYQTAQFLRSMLGFQIVGYRGPETGERETASYLLASDNIRFAVTAALGPDHAVARHVLEHGPGVHDVGFEVPSAEEAFELAIERGAEPETKPTVIEEDWGRMVHAAIRTYGDTIHSLIELEGAYPDYVPRDDPIAQPVGLHTIDHVVANVELGKMNEWVEFYDDIFGFTMLRHFDDEAIATEFSALMSKVVWDGTGHHQAADQRARCR